MEKKELIQLLDSLIIEKIESFEIRYKSEKCYGIYSESETRKITYNK